MKRIQFLKTKRIGIRKGISLIEVVLALAVACYIMTQTYMLIGKGVYLQKEAISLTNAVFLAKIKMAQIDSSPKLETTSSNGEIPGYIGYRYEVEIKEKEIDLLELAEGKGKDKGVKDLPPEDMLGKDSTGKFEELRKKRGGAKGSNTGGTIKVFSIRVAISYPSGGSDKVYEVETFKSSKF